ncbi:bifunctional UDP-N-acetylglucosamine diphosphorylase/glucosamine-1-phosphate N-acetyltransferase GlmU [Methylocella silvestris]|uniref:Bifunctional protein GlmU n=1 Tax=Methylocella silvestris TaxID=199596 RepID=A0A2J7TEJ3_METSI|nr:bifunctional UDP-N-acetylglucosamine diphosphorylase/glucosamine-1-phosphate N-acetyltransferase GlmU [Methylocella silvestris]PNG25186.1 bifunctional N-acetylglucosamine-1-phosphate uridyltransferase/glucosamine-1-phosphate acetyltransferase [Methylocella silvestris]
MPANSSRSLKAPAYPSRTCLAIVLAAGNGKRMRSRLPKAMHKIAGRSMLGHVLNSVAKAGADKIVVVVGPDQEALEAEARLIVPDVECVIQAERRGTAHAVLAAREAIAAGYDDIIVAFADTPLVQPETFSKMRIALAAGETAVVCLGFEAKDPTGYGRLIMKDGVLESIREDRDANPDERKLSTCNAGLMGISGRHALDLLGAIGCENSQREYYLTDIVAIARMQKLASCALIVQQDEVMGVNDRAQLALAEALMQARLRTQAMSLGATLVDPASVTLAYDTTLGEDVTIEPHVVFGPGVEVKMGALIRSFSHLEGASIGENATVGPFARLRPGARLMQDVHIGNFVEVKASEVGAGAKINHLSYIGDASVGAKSNVGAGTITCNYDGFAKYRTEIGEGAFIGSHSSLVAPVAIGAGAYVATGSVVTRDVLPDSLVVARARQTEKPGWAAGFRQKKRKS